MRTMVHARWVVLIFPLLCCLLAISQDDSARATKSFQRALGLGVQHGFIFAHSEAVQNTRGANPTGVELSLSWQRTDAAAWDLCNCFPRKGILLAWYDYDNAVLGSGLVASWFLEPLYRLNDGLFFSLRAAVGGGYLSNPYDSLRNPTNMSYSTRLSGYLLVGSGLWIRLNGHWWLSPNISYQHLSNGGSREPNKGINWPTAGLTLNYRTEDKPLYRGPRLHKGSWRERPARLELVLFGNARRSIDLQGHSQRVALVGLGAQLAKGIGRINNITLSAEVYYDAATRRMLARDSLEASAVKLQLAIGHEFILGRFLLSQRVGAYLVDQTPYNDVLFHRWGLQYWVHPRWSIGFNLQAHRQVAEFIDLRLAHNLRR